MHNNFSRIPVSPKLDEAVDKGMREVKRIHGRKIMKKTIFGVGSLAAVFAVMLMVCLSNPVMASKLPLIGNLFNRFQKEMTYSGDYSEVAKPLTEEGEEETAYTQTNDGLTVTLSEVYCNNQALYITVLMKSEEPFPETLYLTNGEDLYQPNICMYIDAEWDFRSDLTDGWGDLVYLEGEMMDEYTYIGVMRVNMNDVTRDASEAIAEQEAQIAAGTSWEDAVWNDSLVHYIEVPASFKIKLNIAQVIGNLATPETIDLGMSEEELSALSDEEYSALYKEKESQGDWGQFPNKHENCWYDGPWTYEIQVEKEDSKTQVVEIEERNEDGIGISRVEKTPFEITIYEAYPEGIDSGNYFPVMTDANGDLMPSGSGWVNTYAIQDRDISKIDLFLCDYIQYMDELKGYYWSEDYEEKRKEKTFKEYLEQYAAYHVEVRFDEQE